MKKVLTTATAIVFALGLTVSAQAAAEKAKTMPGPQAAASTQQVDKYAAKAQTQKVATAEAKKAEATGPAKTAEVDKTKKDVQAPATAGQEGAKDVKAGAPEKKAAPEAPKTDKK